jgi:hypothetical protein
MDDGNNRVLSNSKKWSRVYSGAICIVLKVAGRNCEKMKIISDFVVLNTRRTRETKRLMSESSTLTKWSRIS